MWDVVLFCFCLLLVCRVWARHTALSVYIVLSDLLLGAAYHSCSFVTDAPRRSIVFYNVRGCPSVHCLADNSRSWLIYADNLSSTSYLQHAFSPYWNHLHLEYLAVTAGDYSAPSISVRNRIVFYAGKRICLLCGGRWRNKVPDAVITADYLHVSQGYKGSIKESASLFDVSTIVAGLSLSGYYRNRPIDDCISLGIPYLLLSEKGSIRILL